eukprot:TRINITY_DN862_c0_g1_i1.p1 TRINITY_DN862_c0_g1~~TRINITY_DN862_c0_g1_i1.p1  ORF type:complete len:230 (-),score=57.98 TRINITY_DN862_c0_g1_i1:162-824(-)
MAPILKLVYFDFGGRAEVSRLALHLGGVAFEDERVGMEEFGKQKAEGRFLFGSIPVLFVDGAQAAQSNAIARYAAKIGNANLYPTDAFQALQVDMILDTCEELTGKLSPSIQERDEEKKKQLREAFLLQTDNLKRYFGPLETIASANAANGWTVGDHLTLADLAVANSVGFFSSGRLDHIPKDITDQFPTIKAIAAKVQAHPKVAEFHQQEAERKAAKAH